MLPLSYVSIILLRVMARGVKRIGFVLNLETVVCVVLSCVVHVMFLVYRVSYFCCLGGGKGRMGVAEGDERSGVFLFGG